MRVFLILLALLTSACASRYRVPEAYSDLLREGGHTPTRRTVVFILVDGLSNAAVKAQLSRNRIPQIERYFLRNGRQPLYQARSVFPSLTFPAITSLLTERPVSATGALGNILATDDDNVIHFDEPLDRSEFSRLLKDKTVFFRLQQHRSRTVSLDYELGRDASVHSTAADLKSGIAIQGSDYLYVDQKHLESLQILLTENPPSQWPELVFIHLVGVDFLSHDYGPLSAEALSYLELLDSYLGDVFKILEQAESKHRRTVIAMLSADHGFAPPTTTVVDLKRIVRRYDRSIRLFNEGRVAALIFPPEKKNDLPNAARVLAAIPDVESVAYAESDGLRLLAAGLDLTIRFSTAAPCAAGARAISIAGGAWACPEALDRATNSLVHPYFISNLVPYFQAPNHPDMVVIPRPGAVFHSDYRGQHGGPTRDEVIVPLFLRNATLSPNQDPPPLWRLFNFL